MSSTDSRLEEIISQFRHPRPTSTPMPPAADPNEFWRRLALKSIDNGYFKSADEFVRFVEACTRFLGFEQVIDDRGYAHRVRNLAEAIARQWSCGTALNSAPSADEIAGLLQSEWVTSGRFKLLRSAGAGQGSA